MGAVCRADHAYPLLGQLVVPPMHVANFKNRMTSNSNPKTME